MTDMEESPRFDSWVIHLTVLDLYEQHGFESIREGARFLHLNRSTLDRILTGKTQIHDPTRIHGIASRLGASPALADQLFHLAVQTHDSSASGFHWPSWRDGGMGGPPFRVLEAAADRLDILELTMITGLLQSEAYIEFQAKASPTFSEKKLPETKKYKLSRQEKRFGEGGKGGAETRVVMPEQCLLSIKGTDFYESQIEYMLDKVERHGIGIYILPVTYEANLVLTRPFSIMGFDRPVAFEVVFMESYLGSEWAESKEAVEGCRKLYTFVLKACTELGAYVGC